MIYSSNNSIRQILRARPMAVQILEEEFGQLIWDHQESTLVSLCTSRVIDVSDCLARIAKIPQSPPDTDWDNKPIYWLIDHLVRNHEAFREKEMPEIQSLLVEERLPAYPDGYIVKLLLQEYQHFQADFLKHMAEEEDFLFPKILRNEACLRYNALGPETHRGSVTVYLKSEAHQPEAEFKRMIISIREKLRNQHLDRPAAEIARKAETALDGFADRLLIHAELETNVLFPRVELLERKLYENHAPGRPRHTADK